MTAVVETPLELLESVAGMRFPPRTDARLQSLMDRNTNGVLTPDERVELESLVELSESIAVVRAKALRVLGRKSP
ncbi:unnamed protein product [Gemmataceae bacterium]|nr:unnamed protein product [Gemmataceae bacterium]VTU01122.1 unnamed protein product [Gemmataceae bacterium]